MDTLDTLLLLGKVLGTLVLVVLLGVFALAAVLDIWVKINSRWGPFPHVGKIFIALISLVLMSFIGFLISLEWLFYLSLGLTSLVVLVYLVTILSGFLFRRNSFLEYFVVACLGYYLYPYLAKYESRYVDLDSLDSLPFFSLLLASGAFVSFLMSLFANTYTRFDETLQAMVRGTVLLFVCYFGVQITFGLIERLV